MADRAPDEIISEILAPLLKHSDEVFSDTSEKPLLPRYSSSTYLLVCKAWLRVSTPLLYNVVILRTTAQAGALEEVLDANKEFGLFIQNCACAPNITDLFLTLSIWGSDNATGLCSGLPLINPRRVILIDGVRVSPFHLPAKPKKNKQANKLMETLVTVIPKWDNLVTFGFPYAQDDEDPTSIARAEALASALRKSQTLEILLVPGGSDFPEYLRQMRDAPSLKSLCLKFTSSLPILLLGDTALGRFRASVATDPKLKMLVTYDLPDSLSNEPLSQQNILQRFQSIMDPSLLPSNIMHPSLLTSSASSSLAFPSTDPILQTFQSIMHPSLLPSSASSSSPSTDPIHDIPTLETLGQTSGATLQEINVKILEPQGRGSKARVPAVKPAVLSPFSALTHLTWSSPAILWFPTPDPGFLALPNLQKLTLLDCSKSFLAVLSQLSLDSLRDVSLHKPLDVSASVNFLQCHGSKLLELSAPLEVLIKVKVFDVCTNLNNVLALHPYSSLEPERRALRKDFITCDAPHTSLVKIHLDLYTIERRNKSTLKATCANLDKTSFPVLKEIQVTCAKWPTSEQEISKSEWVKLSGLLRPKGIELTDKNGVGWTPRS
ncbi:hypothetical protein FB451DRAFT_1248582 [Mycena latifolia]|nr:hypothetical protein FB451DRAFT_1248582 [Mycena latifolia]